MAMALLPSPIEIENYIEWKDAVEPNSPTRLVTRINTECAARQFGGKESFAREFFVVHALSSENEYSRVVAEMAIESGKPFSIAPKVDLTEIEKEVFFLMLNGKHAPCLKGVCAENMKSEAFSSILKLCSSSIGQVKNEVNHVQWRLADNLEDTSPWPLVTSLLAIIFLLSSILYDCTVGRLIQWIRTGSL